MMTAAVVFLVTVFVLEVIIGVFLTVLSLVIRDWR